MNTRRRLPLVAAALCFLTIPAAAQLPRAVPNDHRTPAGRLFDGELHVTLEAVLAEWSPRGEAGPIRKALTFRESGKAPTTPGPMIRVAAGTPVRVTIRNTLAQPVRVGQPAIRLQRSSGTK